MLADRTTRLGKVGDTRGKLEARAKVLPGAFKLGHGTGFFLYGDPEEVELKSEGVGMTMHKAKTNLLPGRAMTVQVPFPLVDFNGMAIHPAADQPSTAVFPHATVVPKIVDPDLEMLQGVLGALQGLVGA